MFPSGKVVKANKNKTIIFNQNRKKSSTAITGIKIGEYKIANRANNMGKKRGSA